ncbi:MAG: hypothetical protein JEZ07_02380 [Phycisphaerae bacterium]|nr:hypothetical protein [Phycisphaerae bacterium]
MRENQYQKIIISILVILGLSCLMGADNAVKQNEKEIVIIVNNDVAKEVVTYNDMKNMFLNKRIKWSNGKAVVPMVLKSGEIHEKFLKQYVSKTRAQYLSYWKKLIFTGKAKMPKTFTNESELLKYVAKTPGAIGYVSAATAKDSKLVTVITVK